MGQENRLGPPEPSSLSPRSYRQTEPAIVKEQGGSWSRRLLVAHFGINNSFPLWSFAGFTTYEAAPYPLSLLILSTGSKAAIIISFL